MAGPDDADSRGPTLVPDTLRVDPAGRTVPGHVAAARPVASSVELVAMPDGRYAVGAILGRGGMGEVRLARDTRIDRDVAVKLMRRPGGDDGDAIARFLREARVQGRLEHPAVVPVHDLGTAEDGTPYFVMKRLTGITLADVISAQAAHDGDAIERWPRRLLLARLVEVCLAVEFAHTRGVIHRDLKPANIMLGDFGEVYVLDWGIARIATERPAAAIQVTDLHAPGDSVAPAETRAGSLMGTPGYMSPEQMRGEPVDHRTDVFALGCILYEILAGAPALPHDGSAFEATLAAASHRPSERAGDRDVPPELDDACARATAASPAGRQPSVRAFGEAIQAYLDGDRDVARRRELAAEHAAAAARLLATPGEASRADAIREAGRALALQPDHPDAQRVLGRLLLEPPATLPEAAAASVIDERIRTGEAMLRIGWRAYLAALVLLPAIFLLPVRHAWPIAILAVLIGFNAGLLRWGSRRHQPITLGLFATGLIVQTGILTITGALFSPILLLPVAAIGSVSAFLTVPSVRFRPHLVVVVHVVAVGLPLILEWSGVLPRTYRIEGDGLVIQPWAIDIGPTTMIAVVIGLYTAQLIASAAIIATHRRAQEAAQERVHLHAWHLDQLVPPTTGKGPGG